MIKTKQQALKEAQRRFGKTAFVQDHGWRCAHTKEEREAARAELKKVREQISELHKRKYDLDAIVHSYQYSVGLVGQLGIGRINGVGDTWDEAFAEADRREAVIKSMHKAG